MGSESLRRVLVGSARHLRVETDREAWIGVPEARLCGLEVDVREDEAGRVRPFSAILQRCTLRAARRLGESMHTRLVSFEGAKDIDAGIKLVQDKVVPLLNAQKGYRGLSASADRAGGVFGVLSLWDTAADRDASESVLAAVRAEATQVVGGNLTVENFEQLVAEVGEPPPGPGSALMVTRISMDPGKIDDNIAFFESEVAPQIKASPGFQGLRNMINRDTGVGLVGTAWSDQEAMKRAASEAEARREQGRARGVNFGETSFREIVLAELK
jgi:heme-degrading monooxygenase HmoA